jgi:ABC-2 type transport system ATP-binding protein
MAPVIETYHLSKTYRSGFWKNKILCALDDLTLEVQENEILGYLGPNGAGKSTTLKLLMSLIYPTRGHAKILGRPTSEHATRKQIGYLPENPFFYEYLTAEEFLGFYGGLFDLAPEELKQRVGYYLHLAGLYEFRKMQLRKFSKGMVQRMGIVQALINDPKVIFLDEPMSGLDPIGRQEVRDLMLKLKKEGKTIFFSTHILNDVETLCDRVAILNRGKLMGSGLLGELISKEVDHVEILVTGVTAGRLQHAIDPALPLTLAGSTVRLDVAAEMALAPLILQIEQLGGKIVSINPIRQTMEEYFFSLVGKPGRNGRGKENPTPGN